MATDYMGFTGRERAPSAPASAAPKMTLKEQIRARMEEERVAKIMEADAKHTEELMAGANPTAGMSTGERMLAGIGQGMHNIGRNVASMTGLGPDKEALREMRERDQALLDTGAGATGSFVGEMAALAPLGPLARGVVGGLSKARSALTAATRAARAGQAGQAGRALTGVNMGSLSGRGLQGAAYAGGEGAIAGAITADPDSRLEGAQSGAITGAVLNKTLGSLNRKFGRGAKKTDAANELLDTMRNALGREPTIPVAMGAKSNITKVPFKTVLPMFPLARGGARKVSEEFNKDWTETAVRQAFSKKRAPEVMQLVNEGMPLVKAIETVKKNMPKTELNYLARARDVLEEAASPLKGQPLTPQKLDAVAMRQYKSMGTARPFFDITDLGQRVMGEGFEESTVAGRRAYNKTMNAALTGGGMVGMGVVPYLAVTGATRAATSAPVQRNVMGTGILNAAARGADESILANALRNAMATDDGEM